MPEEAQIVVVGGGHAGTNAAAALRQTGYAGRIVLLDEQDVPPYHRPVLSKAWLTQAPALDSVLLRPRTFFEGDRIDLRLATRVEAIDRAAREVCLAGGTRLSYQFLILACGASPRRLPLPGADLHGVYMLRTLADADRISAILQPRARLTILGGGYIGLEVAASARTRGADVILVERENRLLARVASPAISARFASLHRGRGVDIRLGTTLEAIEGLGGQVTGVRLAGGEVIECDHVLVAVGAQPREDLARSCGLDCGDGVVVDAQARTSDPRVFAIGDMAFRPMPLYGRAMRLESVANALEQAKQAACAIMGRPAPAPEVPWFWSDQYQAKLQIAGILGDADSTIARRHDGGGLAIFHLRGDRVRCVEAVDAAQDFMGGKLLIGSGKAVDAQMLGDPSVPLKFIVASGHAKA